MSREIAPRDCRCRSPRRGQQSVRIVPRRKIFESVDAEQQHGNVGHARPLDPMRHVPSNKLFNWSVGGKDAAFFDFGIDGRGAARSPVTASVPI